MNQYIKSVFFCGVLACLGMNTIAAQTTQPSKTISTQPTSKPTTQAMKKSELMPNKPYHNIGEYPSTFTTATAIQRTIDGLGYRYHWASEGLLEADLNYSPGNDGITTFETLKHIHNLSVTIMTTVKGQDNLRPSPEYDMDYEELRNATLENIKAASDFLAQHPNTNFDERELTFVRGEKRSAFPFWNLLNGPILDAVYHTGQIVSFRRTSGNPVHPKMNVFSGKAPY